MADSETSTTLPIASRGVGISTGFTAPDSSLPQPVSPRSATEDPLDPAVVAGRKWRAAYKQTLAWCRKQQRLETKLQRTIGMPHAMVRVTGLNEPARISSLCDLVKLAETYPEAATFEKEVMADLAAHQERWAQAARSLGYSNARRNEDLAAAAEQRLADILWSTPSSSFAGVAGKLEAAIDIGEPKKGSTEFPWPQIRSALADLRRLAKADQQQVKSLCERPAPLAT
jgi:hypothetical protein